MNDNSVIAIISLIMVGIGFSNGFVSGVVYSLDKMRILREKLQEAIDTRFELDNEIDRLEERNEELLDKCCEYEEILTNIRNYTLCQTPTRLNIRKPNSPLVRSSCIYDDSSDSEYECPNITPCNLESKMD